MPKAQTKDKRPVTVELTETNYGHLQEIADRFKKRGIKEMSTVEDLVHYCLLNSFHSLDIESYEPKELEPISVNISGIVALPPGTTAPGDVRGGSTNVMHRINNAFPFNSLHVGLSATNVKSKKAQEWKEAISDG